MLWDRLEVIYMVKINEPVHTNIGCIYIPTISHTHAKNDINDAKNYAFNTIKWGHIFDDTAMIINMTMVMNPNSYTHATK